MTGKGKVVDGNIMIDYNSETEQYHVKLTMQNTDVLDLYLSELDITALAYSFNKILYEKQKALAEKEEND